MDAGGVAPVGLVGALAVQMRADLGVTVTVVAVAVAVFFVSGGVVAVLIGPEIDRLGWRRSAIIAASLSTASLLGIAAVVSTWWQLFLAVIVGGAGLAITMPSTNVLLFQEMPARRRGTAISIKQAAVPAALLVAGVAVPAVALTVGWRWAFVGAAVVPLLGLAIVPRRSVTGVAGSRQSRVDGRAAQRRLMRVGVGVFLASLLPGALTGFCVVALVDAGIGPSAAGLVFAASNVVGVVVRVLAGWLAEKTGTDGYRPVAVLMVLGGGAVCLLSTGRPGLMILGSLIAFGLGCGWVGLMFFLVVRSEASNPGSSGAVVQTGGMLGSGVGPGIVAAVQHQFGLELAWLVIGCAVVAGGLLLVRARGAAVSATAESRVVAPAHEATAL